jgi:predicted nuclease with TOPRIM domain
MEKDHLEVLLEDIREKFDLVLEGHDVLRQELGSLRTEVRENKDETNFKIDALHQRIEAVQQELKEEIRGVRSDVGELGAKIDHVAVDLAAHRADTESHPKGYKVSE